MLALFSVKPEPDNIPPHINDEALELYVLGRSSETAFHTIDSHVRWCSVCRDRADVLGREADLLAETLSRATPIFRHDTPDGEITAHVRRMRDGVWGARLIGPQLDCGGWCASEDEARVWSETALGEMLPEERSADLNRGQLSMKQHEHNCENTCS